MNHVAAQLQLRQRRGFLDRITSVGSALHEFDSAAGGAVRVQAEEWENFGLATVDSSLIYSMIDVLLAAAAPDLAAHRGRPLHTIETIS